MNLYDGMYEFVPQWLTIPEFQKISPVCMYHKANQEREEQEAGQLQNLHVLGRSRITGVEKTQAGSWNIYISADDYYKLYVNGIFVGQGPAPGYPEHYYYNKIDISSCLKDGDNILVVHLYYQGLVNRVWNSGDKRFAFACEIVDNEGIFRQTVWKYQVSQAYSGETTGYDTQFLENFTESFLFLYNKILLTIQSTATIGSAYNINKEISTVP